MRTRLGLLCSLCLALTGCSLITDSSDYMFVERFPDAGSDAAVDSGKADTGPVDGNMDAPMDGQGDSGPTGIQAQVFVAGLAELACERVSRCETKRGSQEVERLALQVCHPKAVQRDLIDATLSRIEEGLLSFDPDEAQSCLEQVQSAQAEEREAGWPDQDCRADPIPWMWAQCAAALAPAIGKDGVCQETRDCKADRVCTEVRAVCGGHCSARAPEEASCTAHDDCEETLACINGVCAPRGTSGAVCNSDRECARTSSADYFCDAGECALRLVINSSCVAGSSAECGGTMLCVAPTIEGAPVCRPREEGAQSSEPCNDARPCGPGLRCSAEGSVCVAVGAATEPCTSDDQCAYGLSCQDDACAPRPVVDDACSSEDGAPDCLEGICQNDVCKLAPATSPCTFDLTAVFATCSGYCSVDGECANQEIINRPCIGDYQCPAPNLVCRVPEVDGGVDGGIDAGPPELLCLAPACK